MQQVFKLYIINIIYPYYSILLFVNKLGRHVRGVVVSQIKSDNTDLGPQSIDINFDGTLIAIGSGCDIFVYSSKVINLINKFYLQNFFSYNN